MLRIFSSIAVFLMGCLNTAGVYANPSEKLDYYVVDALAEPFQIVHTDAPQKGYVTDIVEALAAQLDLELTTHVVPSPRIEKLLNNGAETNWIAYDSPAWNSLSKGIFLETPLLTVRHSAVHCGHGHKFGGRLAGHSFAVLKHFRYPGLSDLAKQGKIELTPVKSYEQGFSLVDLGRVDGFIEMDTRLKYNLTHHAKTVKCREVSDIGDIEPSYEIWLTVSQNMNETTIRKLNEALQQLKANGFLKETLDKYTK